MNMIVDFKALKKQPEWLSYMQIQLFLDRSPSTVCRIAREPTIIKSSDGRKVLIKRDSLIQTLQAMPTVTAA